MARKLSALVASVAAAVIVGAGASSAQAALIPSHITDVQVNCIFVPGDDCLWGGYVTTRKKCRANRTVKMFAEFAGGRFELADVDRTSHHGAFGGRGISSEVSEVKVTVTRKRLRGGDICKGATFFGV